MSLALRPTFSESWYRVASLKIRLRPGAQITRQFHRGERWFVVRDPAQNQFMRLSDGAYHFIGLLDGKRSVAEAWELAGGQMDDAAPTQPEVIQILSQLHAANLLEADISPDAQVLLRRYKAHQSRQWKQRAMSALFPRIPIPYGLFALNAFLARWIPVARLLFSTGGMIAWLALVTAALLVLAPEWASLKDQTSNALAYDNWVWLWAVFVFTKVIHEFGHAFACKRYGGEVHEMGIMFLVFIPTPYVDASAAWAFPSRWQRMFVGAAGMYTELAFAAIAAFVWKYTNADVYPILNSMAFNAMLVASVSTVLFNANPLLRYDGYYMLSDFLEIPNLQQKSKEYGWGLIKRHVFRVKQTQPLPPAKQRFELFTYWILSSIYRIFVGLMIMVIVSGQVPVLGIVMAIGAFITWAIVPLITLFRYLTIEPELHRKRGRAWAFTLAMGVLIFFLIGLWQFPAYVWSEAILEPEQRQVLRAEYDGLVVDTRAVDQQELKAGDVVMVMENRTLAAEIQRAEASLNASLIRRQQAIATDPTQRMIEEVQIQALRDHLAVLEGRNAQLTIRAPFDGLFVSPRIHEMEGQYLKRGQEFAIIATLDRLEARAVIDQNNSWDLKELEKRLAMLEPGQPDTGTEIRLAGEISTIINPKGRPLVVHGSQQQLPHPSLGPGGGGTVQVDPRDEQQVKPVQEPFEVVMKIDNQDLRYMPGQRAYVRFTTEPKSIVYQAWRKLSQLFQSRDLGSEWT